MKSFLSRPLPAISQRRWIYHLFSILLVLLGIRIAALAFNGTDLFFDEAQYWSWSEEPAFGYFSKPPMIAWMIRAATQTCGMSEFCIRLPSPLFYTMTAVFVFLIGWRLYDTRTGVISAIAFATLPGVSVSAGIISTDVPLLTFWAMALFAFNELFETKRWWPSVLLALALGLGLNAKYAMAWFGLCAAIYLAMTPQRRWILKDTRLWFALILGALMIVPNILWNMENKFATFSHTAANAKWGGDLFHPLKALEFFGAQFGVFGPILFGALLVISFRAVRQRLPSPDRLLLAFSVPVVVMILLQALISRAHANWAAVAYVAASVLVIATMIRDVAMPWLRASLLVHVLLLVMVVAGTTMAGRYAAFGVDPFARTLGWRQLAQATRAELDRARTGKTPFSGVITDDRQVTSELLYYMRNEKTPLRAFKAGKRPHDHFELTRPFKGLSGDPVLLVSLIGKSSPVLGAFKSVKKIGERSLDAGPLKTRRVTFYALSGYMGR